MRAFKGLVVWLLLVAALGSSVAGSAVAVAARPPTPGYLRIPTATLKQLEVDFRVQAKRGGSSPTFIKVGDSNTTTHLALYGLGCFRYQPVGLRPELEAVVRRYRNQRLPIGRTDIPGATCNHNDWSNSFSRVSYATRGGTTFSFPLETGNPFGESCAETALLCELDEVGPRYAFVQLGTNEALYSSQPGLSEASLLTIGGQLGEIIQTVRSHGVIPIVLTAPVANDGSLWVSGVPDRIVEVNQMIRAAAKVERVPLIDLWLAQMQQIGAEGNFGLDQGGVHLSSPTGTDRWLGTTNLSPANRARYGMNLRSYLILSALDRLDRIRSQRPGRMK